MTLGWSTLRYETRIFLLAVGAGLPGALTALSFLWFGGSSPKVQWTLSVFIVTTWFGFAAAVRHRVVHPLQTVANLLQASREGDFSLRARSAVANDALGEVMLELNVLSATLMEQRLGAVEATVLLSKVIEEIDVAIFTFDGADRLRLVNPSGVRLLGRPAEELLGRTATSLGLAEYLVGPVLQSEERSFASGSGRFEMRRSSFREEGLQHHLLVIADLSRALREEERQAWKRLIRVLGHEFNNSLAPIKSMAATLAALVARPVLPSDWREDAARALGVIAQRSDSLARFLSAYTHLARLPPPVLRRVELRPLVQRVAELETRLSFRVDGGPETRVKADPDQLEQLLINLVRNAADAALETGGRAWISWERVGTHVEVRVEDEGPGLAQTSNLFVPFFTTKPGGSGIGLVLCRQIAEAHGGSLTLENRGAEGCTARLRLRS